MNVPTVCILLATSLLSLGCATQYGLSAPAADERQLVRETVLRAADTPDAVREFSYSSEGKLSQEKLSDAKGSVRETVFYEYKDGRMAERRVFSHSGELTGRRTYTYTSKGLPETENYFDGEGRLLMSSHFAYNYWGDRTEWTTINAAGSLMARTRYTYEKGRPVTMVLSGSNGEKNLTITTAYNAEGRRILETYVNAAGFPEKEVVFSYDEQGRLLCEETFSSVRSFQGKTVYEYSAGAAQPEKIYRYDSRGNPQETVIQEFALLRSAAGPLL